MSTPPINQSCYIGNNAINTQYGQNTGGAADTSLTLGGNAPISSTTSGGCGWNTIFSGGYASPNFQFGGGGLAFTYYSFGNNPVSGGGGGYTGGESYINSAAGGGGSYYSGTNIIVSAGPIGSNGSITIRTNSIAANSGISTSSIIAKIDPSGLMI